MAGVITAAATVLGSIIALLTFLRPEDPVPETAPPVSEPSTKEFADDFDGQSIDEDLWTIENHDKAIFQEGSSINFAATAPNSAGRYGNVAANIGALSVREVSLDLRLVSHQVGASAAAGVQIFLADGREYSAYLGTRQGDLRLIFSSCTKVANKEECTPQAGPRVHQGVPINIVVREADNSIEFYVDGSRLYVRPIEHPISRVQLGMYADPGGVFQVSVGSIRIKYL
ncbi:MAG: hypothetical protein ACRDYA_08965 [Egibacteraceae bacterium]